MHCVEETQTQTFGGGKKCVQSLVSLPLIAYGLSVLFSLSLSLFFLNCSIFYSLGGPSIAISFSVFVLFTWFRFSTFLSIHISCVCSTFICVSGFVFRLHSKIDLDDAAWTIWQMEFYFPSEFKFQNSIRYTIWFISRAHKWAFLLRDSDDSVQEFYAPEIFSIWYTGVGILYVL